MEQHLDRSRVWGFSRGVTFDPDPSILGRSRSDIICEQGTKMPGNKKKLGKSKLKDMSFFWLFWMVCEAARDLMIYKFDKM